MYLSNRHQKYTFVKNSNGESNYLVNHSKSYQNSSDQTDNLFGMKYDSYG